MIYLCFDEAFEQAVGTTWRYRGGDVAPSRAGVLRALRAAVGSNDLRSLNTRRSVWVAVEITSCPAVSVGNLGSCSEDRVSNSEIKVQFVAIISIEL